MRLEIDADTSFWLPLPSAFPTEAGQTQQEWEDSVLARMRPAWNGALTSDLEPIVRGALQHGLASVQPEDTFTLQFWPGASIVNVVVHITAAEWPAGERVPGIPLDEEVLRHGVLSEPFETEALGPGAQVTFYFEAATEPRALLAGAGYFFNGPSGFISVTSDPTIPEIFAVLIPQLTRLVDGIEVHGGTWLRAEPLPLVSGEEWPDFHHST
jgi:hypothetical protein